MESVVYKERSLVSNSYDELLKKYVEEKFDEVHYELILDSLFMQKIKDEVWKEKRKRAQILYEEARQSVATLWFLLEKESEQKRGG
jgi:hypothetical protein